MSKPVLTGMGGVAAAFLASLCCVGPLLFVSLGVGAGLAGTFEPLRPVFGILMVAFLAVGFWTVYGGRAARSSRGERGGIVSDASNTCDMPAAACMAPARRGRDVALLWSATVFSIVIWSFPTWSLWLL